MATFLETATRVATELRRSNLVTEAKDAINDAIAEAASTRFYFNEMRAVSFPTVAAQEYYADQGLVEIDAMYYLTGTTRYEIWPVGNMAADARARGSVSSGQLDSYSRQGTDLRLYPVPGSVVTVYMDGFGKLTPTPLTADSDTNKWLTEGEQLIRAMAKRNVMRDVVKDFTEAAVYDATAQDYARILAEQTTLRLGTGVIRATQF